MPINKQNLSISFAQGVDTKTDPAQVVPGKLVEAENITFGEGMAFNKRAGFHQLTDIDAGQGIDTFKEELVCFDGASLKAFNPANNATLDKGRVLAADLTSSAVFSSANRQYQQDSAYHSAGLFLYVWVDSALGAQYVIVSQETKQKVINTVTIGNNSTLPRAFCLGNYLIVTYVNSSTNNLRYIAIPAIDPSNPRAVVSVATNVDATAARYDGVVANNSLYLAWNASDVGGAIRYNYLTAGLALSTEEDYPAVNGDVAICVFADNNYAPPRIWIGYADGTSSFFIVVNGSSLATIVTDTIISPGAALNITGAIYAADTAKFYCQFQNDYGFTSINANTTVRSDYIEEYLILSGTALYSMTLRSVGLVGKAFIYDDLVYLPVAYGPPDGEGLEPTYFIINLSQASTIQIRVLCKYAYTNGGSYASDPLGMLHNVNFISDTKFELSYLNKNLITTQAGTVYTQTGVYSLQVELLANNQFIGQDIGNNLNINGGYLYAYDGSIVAEQNFHLFPEDLGATNATTGGHQADLTAYSYVAVYAWTDAQGNVMRSAPSVPISITTGNSGTNVNLVTVRIPNVRITARPMSANGAIVEVYRTMPSIASGIYFLVSSITSPILSSSGTDDVSFADGRADVAGQPILYTTGGVIENTGAPAFCSTTIFKNRLVGINSENRNQAWYSKQVLPATPVEMSDLLTMNIDPRFGECQVTSVMDDKLLFFKGGDGAIFYVIGDGPDSTGAQNNFSESVFISSVVGCENPDSIVLTPDGTMFQSNNGKGIWIIDRSLQVSYIGADVQRFNDYTVTSAQLVPNTTQVRFTLSDNQPVLIYNYYYKQWSWDDYSGHKPVAATVYQSLFTYINDLGLVLQETPGTYSDNGTRIGMSLTTGWLSLGGFQGYQRLYAIYLIGRYISAHDLSISVAYDYNPDNVDTCRITPAGLLGNVAYGDDPYYGSTQFYGGTGEGPREQFRINVSRQKCQAIQITIREILNADDPTIGAGLTLEAINLLAGIKGSYPRLPATNIVST